MPSGYDAGVKPLVLTGIAALVLAGTAGARPDATVIRIISVTTALKAHQASPKGPSKGDYVILDDRLANASRRDE